MATAGTKYITATFISIVVLLGWFMGSDHFDVEINLNNITCRGDFSEPCEVPYNITLKTLPYFYIRNSQSLVLNFSPDVKGFYSCKKDGRMKATWRNDRSLAPCGIGWKEFDWKTPLTTRYKYINKFYKNKKQEFKLVIFKFNPTDEIKWGGKITGEEFDPIFYGIIDVNVSSIESCVIKQRSIPDWRTCSRYVTIIGNGTNETNETQINHTVLSEYPCYKGTKLEDYEVCTTIGYTIDDKKLICPDGYRCDIIENELCILDCNDGDCNYNAKYVKDGRWSSKCIEVSKVIVGNIRVSDYKKETVSINEA